MKEIANPIEVFKLVGNVIVNDAQSKASLRALDDLAKATGLSMEELARKVDNSSDRTNKSFKTLTDLAKVTGLSMEELAKKVDSASNHTNKSLLKVESIAQKIGLSMTGVNGKLDSVIAGVTNYSKKIDGLVSLTQKTVRGFAALAVVKVVADGVSKLGSAVMESERGLQRLDTLMSNVPGTTDSAKKSVATLSEKLQDLSVISDDVYVAGASQLATFQLQASSIKALLPSMADLAVAAHGINVNQQQMIQTGNLVGKVFTGQVGALTEYGVTLSETQKKLLQTGNEEQKVAVLTEVLRQNFGGLAQDMTKVQDGSMQQLRNDFRALVENLGTYVVPGIAKAVSAARTLVKGTNSIVSAFMTEKPTVYSLSKEFIDLQAKTELTADEKERLKKVTTELAKAFPDVIEKINEETGAFEVNHAKLLQYSKDKQLQQALEDTKTKIQEVTSEINTLTKEQGTIQNKMKDDYLADSVFGDTLSYYKQKIAWILQNNGIDLTSLLDAESFNEAINKISLDTLKLKEVEDVMQNLSKSQLNNFEKFREVATKELAFRSQYSDALEDNKQKITEQSQSLEQLNEILVKVNQAVVGEIPFEEFALWYDGLNRGGMKLLEATQEQYSILAGAVETYLKTTNEARKMQAVSSGDFTLLPNIETQLNDLRAITEALDNLANGKESNLAKLLGMTDAQVKALPKATVASVAESLQNELLEATIRCGEQRVSVEERAQNELDKILRQTNEERVGRLKDEKAKEMQLLEEAYQDEIRAAKDNAKLKSAIDQLYTEKRLTLEEKYADKELQLAIEKGLQVKSYQDNLLEVQISSYEDAKQRELLELSSWFDKEAEKVKNNGQAKEVLTELFLAKSRAINDKYRKEELQKQEEAFKKHQELTARYQDEISNMKIQAIADSKERELATLDKWLSDQQKNEDLAYEQLLQVQELYHLQVAAVNKKYRDEEVAATEAARKAEMEQTRSAQEEQLSMFIEAEGAKIGLIRDSRERQRQEIELWYEEQVVKAEGNKDKLFYIEQLYELKKQKLDQDAAEEERQILDNRIEYEHAHGLKSKQEYLQHWKDRLQVLKSEGQEWSAEYIALMEKINDIESTGFDKLKNTWNDTLTSMGDTLSNFLADATISIFDDTTKWEDKFDSLRQAVRSSLTGLISDFIGASAKYLVAQRATLTETVAMLGKTVLAYLGSAYVKLLNWYAPTLGPVAPVAAGATIVGAIAALGHFGYKGIKWVAGGSSSSGAGSSAPGGARIVNWSGKARDEMTDIFAPLQELAVMSNYIQNQTEILNEIFEWLRTSNTGAAQTQTNTPAGGSTVQVDTLNLELALKDFGDLQSVLTQAGTLAQRSAQLGGVNFG